MLINYTVTAVYKQLVNQQSPLFESFHYDFKWLDTLVSEEVHLL
jgi:hypothetical protein